MKIFLMALVLASSGSFAAPLIGTCEGLYADCVGPKLDSGSKITKRCELDQYRTSYYVYEYSDPGRKETGVSIVTVGSSSAVSDSLVRTTYPQTTIEAALTKELIEDGMSAKEAKAELKKLSCKVLKNEVL